MYHFFIMRWRWMMQNCLALLGTCTFFSSLSSACSFILHMRCGYLGSSWNLGLANDINWIEIVCALCSSAAMYSAR